MTADEASSDKNGDESRVGSAALYGSRGKSDDRKKLPGGQEDQPKSEAPAPDGSPAFEGRLAQALRPSSFEREVKWCTGLGQTETKCGLSPCNTSYDVRLCFVTL